MKQFTLHVFRIRDWIEWILMRIRILGSVLVTTGLKVIKKSQNSRNQGFSSLLVDGRIRTRGRIRIRTKKLRIRMRILEPKNIRIRILNTALNVSLSFVQDALPLGTFTKYTWSLTNILQVKQIFDTPLGMDILNHYLFCCFVYLA